MGEEGGKEQNELSVSMLYRASGWTCLTCDLCLVQNSPLDAVCFEFVSVFSAAVHE